MQRRPCWVEISTACLEENYRVLVEAVRVQTQLEPLDLLAIVKADAYGHSLALCAPAAVRACAKWLGVTSVEEGVAARLLCPDGPDSPGIEILVISGPFVGQGSAVIRHRLTVVVWESWQLEELVAAAGREKTGGWTGPLPVHLELDTGMSRQGVDLGDLDARLGWFTDDSPLRLDGLMTHLYAADESDGEATREQLARLEAALARVHARGLRPAWLHVGNSAAVLGGRVAKGLAEIASRFGMRALMRPGLGLYGMAPEFSPEQPARVGDTRARLQLVLAWKTQVVSLREIGVGDVVGYNGTFVATEPMRVALLAVGYADGLRRELSNCGSVLVNGRRCPIIGRISMDQTVVDVTEIAGVQPGDEVVLLGRQGGEWITAEEHAGWAGTIPWEIFTGIGSRVERRSV